MRIIFRFVKIFYEKIKQKIVDLNALLTPVPNSCRSIYEFIVVYELINQGLGKMNEILIYPALPRVAKILDIWACSDYYVPLGW